MKNKLLFLWFMMIFSILTSSLTCAAQPKQSDAAQQALKKAQGLVRQLSDEKNALDAENKALAQEKTDLLERVAKLESQVKQLVPLQSEVAAQKTHADNLRTTNQTLSAQLVQTQDSARQLSQKWQESQAQVKRLQADNQQLVLMVNEREAAISQCYEKNKAVIAAAQELGEKFQHKSFWTILSESEPLTGIGNVDVQNDLETFQYHLKDLNVNP
jgi:chromosome segregation ATPase